MRKLTCFTAALLLTALAVVPAFAQEPAEGTEVKPEDQISVYNNLGILTLETKDGNFKWFTDARLYVDVGTYWASEKNNSYANGSSINEARLALNFTYSRDWLAQIDVAYAGNAVDLKDIYLGYTGFKNSMIRVGHFKGPWGLENLISSRFITFMERPMIGAFKPSRNVGIDYTRWGKQWHFRANAFNQGAGDVDTTGEDMGYGYGARFSFAPVLTKTTAVHLGLSAYEKTPKAGSGRTMSLKYGDESTADGGKRFTTGKISNVDKNRVLGVEAGTSIGPLYLQAEYSQDKVLRFSGVEPEFDGWYAHVSYFLTGEHRGYDVQQGEFERLLPIHKYGAVELKARYSTLDLNDLKANIKGGSGTVSSIGANWYVNQNSRIMLDLAHVTTDKYSVGDRKYKPNDRYNYAQMRFQLNF